MDCTHLGWQKFRDQAIKRLSQLNGYQRHLIELAKSTVQPDNLAQVLLAGWVGTPPEAAILELTEDGLATFYTEDGFHAIGSGKAHIYIAHRTFQPLTNIIPLERLRHITTVAASMAQKSELPIKILRVTPTGITNALEAQNARTEAVDQERI